MTEPVTVIAPIVLAKGKTERDLLEASDLFQKNFVANEPGVLRRELVRKPDGTYLDIVQFRSAADLADVMKREMESPLCVEFFAVMDMTAEAGSEIQPYPSLKTY